MSLRTERLILGPLDHIAPRNITQSLIYLSLKEGASFEDAFDSLRSGFYRTLLQAPWLGGLVHLQSQDAAGWRTGQLEIRFVPGQALGNPPASTDHLRMSHLETATTYADLKDAGFPLEPFPDDVLLWSSPFTPDYEVGEPVFAAQANFLEGGCILAMAIAAPVSDGTAMLTITKLWADNCNESRRTHVASLPSEAFDRAYLDDVLLKGKDDLLTPVSDHKGVGELVGVHASNELRCTNDPSPEPETKLPSYELLPRLFYIAHSGYTALRKHSISDTELVGNDLVCAFIWRSVIKALVATATEPLPADTTVCIPFDARPNLAKSAMSGYLGNMNFETTITLRVKTIIASDTNITSLARTIRAHAKANSNESTLLAAYGYLRSADEYATQQIQVTWMPPEEASVGIQSPIVLPFNDTRFSNSVFGDGGRVESFRPMMGEPNRRYRTCFVVPRKQHGGLEFVLSLTDREMEWLQSDAEFNEYAFAL